MIQASSAGSTDDRRDVHFTFQISVESMLANVLIAALSKLGGDASVFSAQPPQQPPSPPPANPPAKDSPAAATNETPKTPDVLPEQRDRTMSPVPAEPQNSKAFGAETPVSVVLSEFLLPEVRHTSQDHRAKLQKVESCLSSWLERPATVADLRDQRLLNRYLAALPYAAATVNGRKKYLSILQRYCFGRSGASDIEMRTVKEPTKLPVAWKVAEVERIIQACRDYNVWQRCDGVDVHIGERTLLALLLIYDTGIRISALMKRQRSDVVDGVLIVPAEDQKTGKEQRFKLSAETLDAIAAAPDVSGRLIPHAYYQARPDKPMRDWLTKILTKAGLPTDCKHKWHCLRRVHATQLARAVSMEAAQRALGHSSIETTKRYVDTTQLDHVAAADAIPRPALNVVG